MNKKINFLIFLPVFLLLANSVHAQEFWSPEYLWTEVLGLPQEWTQPREFIFKFMVPFIALYAILLGLLKSLGIFSTSSHINWVLAFAMAFMTLPSRIFVTLVGITLGFAGMFGYIIFLVLFFGGSYLYAKGFLKKKQTIAAIYSGYEKSARSLTKELEVIREEINKVQAEMLHQKPDTDLTPWIKKIEKLKKQEENIIKKLTALRFAQRI